VNLAKAKFLNFENFNSEIFAALKDNRFLLVCLFSNWLQATIARPRNNNDINHFLFN